MSGDERERAILRTAELLLGQRPIGEISVDELARGAGISRPAFYFYFSSKAAVVLALVDRMVEEAAAFKEETSRQLASDPAGSWRASIEVFYGIFGAHRAVIRAAVELTAVNPEARELWAEVMEGWVEVVAQRIESERVRGAAVSHVSARDLAVALVQMNERVLRAIFVEETPAVAEGEAIDTLVHVWLSAIYGAAQPS
ncbi:MAG: TetR/AcrR family transcriptional regulator [Solirubrobacteraceae bacterium]